MQIARQVVPEYVCLKYAACWPAIAALNRLAVGTIEEVSDLGAF
jgi:hypothetical protein